MSTVVAPPPLPRAAVSPAPAATPAAYPRPLVWTADEFHRVGDTGIWEGRRPMLIGGVIWEQGRSNPPHSTVVGLTFEALRRFCPAGHHVRNQQPLKLGPRHDPEPDLAVVPGTHLDYLKAHPTAALLVVEVSDATLFFDLTTKAEPYAAAGVPEYWVLDLAGRVLHAFRDPQPLSPGGTTYRQHTTHAAGETVAVPGGGPVAVETLLPPAG